MIEIFWSMSLQLEQLQQWYQTSPGKWLLQFEQEQVNKWLPLTRGATVLQLGGLPDTFNIAKHHNGNYYFLSQHIPDVDQFGVDLIASGEELPFLPNSVNLVLLIHLLEYTDHPTAMLKELFDILAPNGKLLLFCFNPWSLWGVNKILAKCRDFPWQGKFISPARLQNWLVSLGFSNIKDKTLCFRSAYNKRRLTRLAFFYEALGQIAVPMLGAVNVFLVEKRVYGSIGRQRHPWRKYSPVSDKIIEPTTRIRLR